MTEVLAPEPHLVASLGYLGHLVFLVLHNVGDGAALNIELKIDWVLSNAERIDNSRLWRATVLRPGAQVQFDAPGTLRAESLSKYERIEVVGTITKGRRDRIEIDASMVDPQKIHDAEVEARRQFGDSTSVHPELQQIADSLNKIAHKP